RLRRRWPGQNSRPDCLLEHPPRAVDGLHGRWLRAHDGPCWRVYGRAWAGPVECPGWRRHSVRLLVARIVHLRADPVDGHRSRVRDAPRDPGPIAHPRRTDEMVTLRNICGG